MLNSVNKIAGCWKAVQAGPSVYMHPSIDQRHNFHLSRHSPHSRIKLWCSCSASGVPRGANRGESSSGPRQRRLPARQPYTPRQHRGRPSADELAEPIPLPNGEVYRPRHRLENKSYLDDDPDAFDKKKWDAVWQPDPLPARAATERDPNMRWGEVSWMSTFGPKVIQLPRRPADRADKRRAIFSADEQAALLEQQQLGMPDLGVQQQQQRQQRQRQLWPQEEALPGRGGAEQEQQQEATSRLWGQQQLPPRQQLRRQAASSSSSDPMQQLVDRLGQLAASPGPQASSSSGLPSRFIPSRAASGRAGAAGSRQPEQRSLQQQAPAASMRYQARAVGPVTASDDASSDATEEPAAAAGGARAGAQTAAEVAAEAEAGEAHRQHLQPSLTSSDMQPLPAAAQAPGTSSQELPPFPPSPSPPPPAAAAAAAAAAAPLPAAPPPVATPARLRPLLNLQNKNQLSADEGEMIAQRLRTPAAAAARSQGQQPLKIFRYAVDDLRLFKALEQAGMAGRVVVVDSVAQADAVLAVKTKRTGKQVSLKEVQAAAKNSGLPFLEVRTVSPQRLAEALAPLLGMQVPAHLQGGGPPPGAAATMKAVQGDGWQELMQVLRRGTDGLELRSGLLPEPDLDDVDVGQHREPFVRKIDMAGRRYTLIRPPRWGSRLAKRRKQRDLAELKAPW